MNNASDVVKNTEFSGIQKKLLNDFTSGKISKDEFLSECAYWKFKYIDCFRFKQMPTKPQEIVDFLNRVKINQSYEAKPEFWRIPHIHSYIESARKIDGENSGNLNILKDIFNDLPKEDLITRGIVKNAIKEYDGWLLETKRMKNIPYAESQDRNFIEKDFLGEQ